MKMPRFEIICIVAAMGALAGCEDKLGVNDERTPVMPEVPAPAGNTATPVEGPANSGEAR